MTISNKIVFFGVMLLMAIGGITPSTAVNCDGFGPLTTTVQADLGTYTGLLKQKGVSEREMCGAMKRFFSDADLILKNDYSVCTSKKKEYAAWRDEISASVRDFKNDDFKGLHCSRFP